MDEVRLERAARIIEFMGTIDQRDDDALSDVIDDAETLAEHLARVSPSRGQARTQITDPCECVLTVARCSPILSSSDGSNRYRTAGLPHYLKWRRSKTMGPNAKYVVYDYQTGDRLGVADAALARASNRAARHGGNAVVRAIEDRAGEFTVATADDRNARSVYVDETEF